MAKLVVPISPRSAPPDDLFTQLASRVMGQRDALSAIVPYVEMFQAGLAPADRPAGVFLLLGPTGTGKTRTVEALAEALHGSARSVVRIDCGEFQMEHEVAKLVGAPPGYLGHRETQPALTQQKLTAATSEASPLALVLFDEIEKAAGSMTRLLLGVLDKGVLRLGDGMIVNFERTLIFLTSNLGARQMLRELGSGFGFQAGAAHGERAADERAAKLHAISLGAVKRRFPPEFVNRIDQIVTYRPLGQATLAAIVDAELEALQEHIDSRLSAAGFELVVARDVRRWLLATGTSAEYGARELKRAILRHIAQPVSALKARGRIPAGAIVQIDMARDGARPMVKVR